jgi:uncharacterized protein HemY
MDQRLDSFFRRHPRLFLAVVVLLTVVAAILLLGQVGDVGLVYKAF